MERDEEQRRIESLLAVSAPFFRRAMRRYEEGVDVRAVARETGAPVRLAADLYVLHRWWSDYASKPHSTFEGTRMALAIGRFADGGQVDDIVQELGFDPEEARELRASYDALPSDSEPFVANEEHPHRFGDVYHWLYHRKQAGAGHASLVRHAGGRAGERVRIVFDAHAPYDQDVADGTQAVMDAAGPEACREGIRWILQAYAPGATTPMVAVLLFAQER